MMNNNFPLKFGGFLIVIATIYWRFLRPRAQGDINFTYTNVKFLCYCFSILTLSIALLMIIFLPIYLKYIAPKLLVNFNTSEKSGVKKLQEKGVKFLLKIHETYDRMLHEFFFPFYQKHFDKNRELWESFVIFFRNYKKHITPTLYIFYFLPPCIISFTYFVEVVVYHKFMYFPLVIFCMIFPISIRIIFYILRFHCKEVEKFLNSHVILFQTNEDGTKFYVWQENSSIIPENRTDELLFEIVSVKEQNLKDLKLFKLYRDSLYFFKARPYFHIFSLLCWLISLSTILYLMLSNAST